MTGDGARPARSGRTRPRRLAAGIVAFGVVGLVTFPDLLGLDRYGPVVQWVALRPHLVASQLLVGGLVGLGGLRRPPLRPVAAGVLVAALLGAGSLVPRAVDSPALGPATGGALTVLSFNVYDGAADVDALAGVIARERPDLVSLPESGSSFRDRLAVRVEPLGYRLWSSTPPGEPDVHGVTALATGHLGAVDARPDPATTFPGIVLSGGGLGDLRFVAFHSVAPVDGGTRQWRADLGQLPRWCAGPGPAVVAGDFNATLDHSAFRAGMRGCADAGARRGAGLTPTWAPDPALRRVGIQIDHVLATPGIEVESFEVLDLPGSDHRALLTRLRRAQAGPGPHPLGQPPR